MRKYFGTDGIRARVGTSPMTPETVLKLGWAAGRTLAADGGASVLIGKDTRISGYIFESVLEAGLSSAGMNVLLLGPLPTPGVACLTRILDAAAGFVVSASHNPYYDNGIKVFSGQGKKLSDLQESEIEAWMDRPMDVVDRPGIVQRVVDSAGKYAEFCRRTVGGDLDLRGMKVVVDCANGAAYSVAPKIFSELGATVHLIGVNPDGFNINADCGALHPQALQQTVLDEHADFGIALDGDGDRLIMADEKGEVVDGDEILMIIADARIREGVMCGGVVGTQMSNLGLERALAKRGVQFVRTQVGDRYVLQELLQRGWTLGGETSGHVICLDKLPTGDAVIAALQLIRSLHVTGRALSDAKKAMFKYPQRLVNVPVPPGYEHDDARTAQVVRQAHRALGDKGRVVVRVSGTEPMVRVMVESQSQEDSRKWAERISQVVSEVH